MWVVLASFSVRFLTESHVDVMKVIEIFGFFVVSVADIFCLLEFLFRFWDF